MHNGGMMISMLVCDAMHERIRNASDGSIISMLVCVMLCVNMYRMQINNHHMYGYA